MIHCGQAHSATASRAIEAGIWGMSGAKWLSSVTAWIAVIHSGQNLVDRSAMN